MPQPSALCLGSANWALSAASVTLLSHLNLTLTGRLAPSIPILTDEQAQKGESKGMACLQSIKQSFELDSDPGLKESRAQVHDHWALNAARREGALAPMLTLSSFSQCPPRSLLFYDVGAGSWEDGRSALLPVSPRMAGRSSPGGREQRPGPPAT